MYELSPNDIMRLLCKIQRIDDADSCWAWQAAVDKDGYGLFKLNHKMVKAHRVMAQLADGPIPTGLLVLHSCDNPPCCRPSHLFRGSCLDNMVDMAAKGRGGVARGERHGSAKLTLATVAYIREEYGAGRASQSALARQTGVSQPLVWRIVHNEIW